MRKRILSLLLVMLLAFIPIRASAQTGGAALRDWEYELNENTGKIILTKYIGASDSVTVPPAFDANGRSYNTVLQSWSVFIDNKELRSVAIGEGVGFLNRSMNSLFKGCSALTDVDLSAVDTSSVVAMNRMFLDCSALETLDLSSFDLSSVTTISEMFSHCENLSGLTGYENWDTSSLQDISWAFGYVANDVSSNVRVTIDLSRWDLSKVRGSAVCFGSCRAQQILLPDSLPIINGYFFNHTVRYEGTSFTVPAGVKKIGYAHTFHDFGTKYFAEFRVAEGNTSYKAVDGVLYSADGKELLAVPRGKAFENGVFEIPEGVEFMGELSYSYNSKVRTVVLPDSFRIEYVPLHAERYTIGSDGGNVNDGTNLSIAIYQNTGVIAYVAKNSNPRYASADGIIYSKDMERVVAVPTRYNKAIIIPEGVVCWGKEAMWFDSTDSKWDNCPGVTIPSTLAVMAPDQVKKLNRLYSNRKDTENPFTITIAQGNTSFSLDENGLLKYTNTGNQAAADLAAAKIEAIGAVEYTAGCEAKIDAAKDVFDALTAAQQALVPNAQALADAIALYTELEAESQTPDEPTVNDESDEPSQPQTTTFWQRIAAFFRSIIEFFRRLFGGGSL